MKFIYLFVLLSPLLSATPNWFYNLEPMSKNEIIGYGIDKDLSKAKNKATASIVESISVSIQSSIHITENDTNGKFNSNSSSNMKSESHAVLSGVKILKSVQVDDKWYIAVKYDNSPLEIKLKKLLPKNLKKEKQNQYLKTTSLFASLNSEMEIDLNYKIIRKDNLWQLRYKDIFLPISQDDFYKLFKNKQSKTISIKANKKKYKTDDKMFFNVKQDKPGYISILYVEHNGKVGILLANLKSKKSFTFPDLKNEDSFTIVNPYKQPIRELYIAIYSNNIINLDSYEDVSDNLLDESNFNFDKLIVMLNNAIFSSYIIKISE